MNINRENARRVHTQILLHPESHHQDIWVTGGKTVDQCGTTGCVAGWGAMLDPANRVERTFSSDYGGGEWYYPKIIQIATGEELDAATAGEIALGFDCYGPDNSEQRDDDAADWLFSPERTRGEVLAQLDHMATTGEFDWSMLDG